MLIRMWVRTRPRPAYGVLCLLLAVLGIGCSGGGERIVPWYITRKLDGYLDLTSAQKQQARSLVDATLDTLRAGELPRWISLFREVRAGIHDGLSDADVARLQRHYDARLDAGVQLLAPQLASLLMPLDAAQLDHFAARMREDVEEQYEELALPKSERATALEKRALRAIRDSVGALDDEQQARICALIRGLPDERSQQYRSAKEHIARFRAFMAQQPTHAAIVETLTAMWEHRYDALGPGHDKASRRAQQRAWLLAVYRLLTPAQRAYAEEKLSDRIRTLKRFTYGS